MTNVKLASLRGVLLLALISLSMGALADDQSLQKAADDLGRSEQSIPLVKSLAADPSKAAGLLVSQLRTVQAEKLLNGQRRPDVEHVLWTIRALRFLTGGKDFCAPTVHKFAKTEEERDREYWLRFHKHSCLTFFAIWPSRGTEYVAPVDVQKKIIAQWKEWYRINGSKYRYKPLIDPKPEDWLW